MCKRISRKNWTIACLSGLPAWILADVARAEVEIEITAQVNAWVLRKGFDTYEDLKVGDRLSTCDTIKLRGNLRTGSSAYWKRVDGSCGNRGSFNNYLGTTSKLIHVGTDIGGAPGPRGWPPGGYFDLLLDEESNRSTATIIEAEGCFENGHCGLTSPMALAVAVEPAPPGGQLVFSGEYGFGLDGFEYTRYVNYPPNPIAFVSVPFSGPFEGRYHFVAPGEAITWYADGTYEYAPAPACTGVEELNVTSCRARACGDLFKAKLSKALPGAPVTFTLDGRAFDSAVVNDRGRAVGRFCGEATGSHVIGVAECSVFAESNCP